MLKIENLRKITRNFSFWAGKGLKKWPRSSHAYWQPYYLLAFRRFFSNCRFATFLIEVKSRRYRIFLDYKLTKLERSVWSLIPELWSLIPYTSLRPRVMQVQSDLQLDLHWQRANAPNVSFLSCTVSWPDVTVSYQERHWNQVTLLVSE